MMYADKTPLPEWLGPIDGVPSAYAADPDVFYPVVLGFMGLQVKEATRYDMETALGVAKKLAAWHAKRCPHGACKTLVIRSDGGRKARWRIASFPVGDKPDISSPLETARRNGAVRDVWNRLMG